MPSDGTVFAVMALVATLLSLLGWAAFVAVVVVILNSDHQAVDRRSGVGQHIDWTHVDLLERVIRVERSFDPGASRDGDKSKAIVGRPPYGGGAYVAPKTAKGRREVGIPKLLLPYLAALDRTEGLVFGPNGERPFKGEQVHERAYDAWDKAGIARVTLHDARHTFASLMIDAGVDISKISKYMGHSSVNITIDRYGHLLPGDRAETTAKFDAYLEDQVGD